MCINYVVARPEFFMDIGVSKDFLKLKLLFLIGILRRFYFAEF